MTCNRILARHPKRKVGASVDDHLCSELDSYCQRRRELIEASPAANFLHLPHPPARNSPRHMLDKDETSKNSNHPGGCFMIVCAFAQ
mmetsp:Transcript_11467/g.39457  ORF Transcript_11467/g.39457 Transcript_11467/m.39457 type:complete len:87 (-) Transcript_11467:296-556(-)